MKEDNDIKPSCESEESVEDMQTETLDLSEQNAELLKEVDDLKNRLLRVSAEYENFRRRSLKEKQELYGNACIDVITQFLPVLDSLERANSVDSDFESFKKGVQMVVSMFYDNLKRLGVDEIDTSIKFDPKLHEAVDHVSDENFESNSIIDVLQKGYIRNDKVIRHSLVKVAN